MTKRTSPSRIMLVLVGLCLLLECRLAESSQKLSQPVAKNLDLSELTIVEAMDVVRRLAKEQDPQGKGLNIVVMTKDLAPIQLQARLSLKESSVPYADLFYALCKRLGLGCRFESHAVVIGSAAKIPMLTPRTEDAVALAGRVKQELPVELLSEKAR